MAFNRLRTVEIARRDDRDVAPFFAGREREIDEFDVAVWNAAAKHKDQAIFRIYQGPPGCGKTSLAAHLEKTRADNTLFVKCGPEDLRDGASLLKRIRTAAVARKSFATRTGALALSSAAEYLKAGTLEDAVRDILTRLAARDATIVIHLDEAHARLQPAADLLCDLHATGLGSPCVVLLTGLGHTRDEISATKGLTRAAQDATRNLEALSEQECERSTMLLFDEVRPEGSRDDLMVLAKLAAQLSHGWPQHLNRAQKAICEELVRVDGNLGGVDPRRIRKRSYAMRHEYYEARLRDHPAFKINPVLTRRVLVEVERDPPEALSDLDRLCGEAIGRAGLTESFHRREMFSDVLADALVGKGLVTNVKGRLNVAIPSMADWAANGLPDFDGKTPGARQ